jgi:hypothetical protein
MESKGIQYSIVQTTSPRGWRWIVYLPGVEIGQYLKFG